MTLSVGFGRIVNDPDAPIRTRQALGRLATPGLLVTDQGLTIDTNGRMVLRLSSGLTESTSGLSVKVKSGGGIVSDDDGLALDDPLGDITVTNLMVNQNANITGSAAVAGNLTADTATVGPNQLTALGLITGNIQANNVVSLGNLNSATQIVTGVSQIGSLNCSGNGFIGGNLTVTGTISGGASGDITPTSIRINFGTKITKMISVFVTLFINPVGSGSQDDYISFSGASIGDIAMCSPLEVLPVGILSWSAMVSNTNQVLIRTSRGLTSGSATVTFRVVVLGFA